jgi:NTP pyrophosphatase (non-canonical NTP hydrolase)
VARHIQDERSAQDAKWGEQNHNPFVWLAIIAEELGEASQAALKATFETKELGDKLAWLAHYREELVQTAAVAQSAIEAFDRNKWLNNVKPSSSVIFKPDTEPVVEEAQTSTEEQTDFEPDKVREIDCG